MSTPVKMADYSDEMAAILINLGMEDFVYVFQENKIGPKEVDGLTQEEFHLLGVDVLGDRVRLKQACRNLLRGEVCSSPSVLKFLELHSGKRANACKGKRKAVTAKTTRRLHVGWKHATDGCTFRLVTAGKGGGKQVVDVNSQFNLAELHTFCEELYFPNGKSPANHLHLEDLNSFLASFTGTPLPDVLKEEAFTVGKYTDSRKTYPVRVYLHTLKNDCSKERGLPLEPQMDCSQDSNDCSKERGLPWTVHKTLLDTIVDPYSTMSCDPNSCIKYDGTSQQIGFPGKQATSLKAILRSLDDTCLLAGSYSRLQQVGAVPFTQLDYEIFDFVYFFIILVMAIIVPIEETCIDAASFVSLRMSTTLSRRIIQNVLGMNTDRCGGGRNGVQPDQTLGNSVSAVGSVSDEVGAVGGTTPDHVKRATSADSKRLQPQVSTVTVPNLQVSLLEEDNYRLRSQRHCVVCRCNARNVLFLPCGHLVCCQECSAKVVSCPICRADIDGRQDVHIPD